MTKVYRASVFTNQKQHWRYDLMSEVYPDGTFELLPILIGERPLEVEDCKPEVRSHLRTYRDVPSWHDPDIPVTEYIKHPKASDLVVHDDPNLHTLMAYGEVRQKRDGSRSARGSGLFTMAPGDWLLFIAHLAYAEKPGEPDPTHKKTGWYLVGCLKSAAIEFAGAGREYSDRVKGHAHWLEGQYADMSWGDAPHNMIVCGDNRRKDQRFKFAVPVLTRDDCLRLIRDKNGKPLDPSSGKQTIKSSIASYTRTGRSIADTSLDGDAKYLRELRSAILERNSTLADLLW